MMSTFNASRRALLGPKHCQQERVMSECPFLRVWFPETINPEVVPMVESTGMGGRAGGAKVAGGGLPLQPRPLREPIRSSLRPKQPESRIILGPPSRLRARRTWSRDTRTPAAGSSWTSQDSAGLWPCWGGPRAICSSCSSETVSRRPFRSSCNGWGQPRPQQPAPGPNHPRQRRDEPATRGRGPGTLADCFLIPLSLIRWGGGVLRTPWDSSSGSVNCCHAQRL